MTDFSCTIDASKFARANLCASTDKTRYYIGGVYITPCDAGGVLMIATDGHCMVIIRDAEGVCDGSAIIKLDPHMLKACAMKRGVSPTLIVENGSARIGNMIQGGVIVDSSFPDWRRVLPSGGGGVVTASFDPLIIARLSKAMGTESITFRGTDDASPCWVVSTQSTPSDAVGVIMPRRGEHKPSRPDWL